MIGWERGDRQFTADNFALLADIGDGAAFFDASGCMLFFNAAWGAFFDLNQDCVALGFEQVWRRALDGGAAGRTAETDRFLAAHLAAFETGTPAPMLNMADGRWLRLAYHRSAAGTLALLTDVTDILEELTGPRLREGEQCNRAVDRPPPVNNIVPLLNVLLNDDRHARDQQRMRCSRPLPDIVADAADGLCDLWGVRQLLLSARLDGELLHQMRLGTDGPPPDLSPILSALPAPIAGAATYLLTLDIQAAAVGPPPVHLHLQPPSPDDQPAAGRLTLMLEAWPDPPNQPASGQGRVLLVEDSGPLADLLEQYLKASGFHVTRAATGTMGLARLTAGDFDLIISDLGVPGIDGLGLFRACRALAAAGRVPPPFLLVTGNITETAQARIRAAGITHILEKPLDCDELVRRAAHLSGFTITQAPARVAVPLPPRPGALDPARIRGWLEKVPTAHVRDLIQRLPAQIEATLKQADELDRAGSTTQCIAALHLLASTTGAVGMVGVVAALAAAERALQAPSPPPLAERLPTIRALVADALTDLSAVLAAAEGETALSPAAEMSQDRTGQGG